MPMIRVQIPMRTPRPRQVDRGQDYESRLRCSNHLGGSQPAAPARSRVSYARRDRIDTDRWYPSFVQWEGRGPTNRRRVFDSLSSDSRSRKHLVRLPGCLTGEAGFDSRRLRTLTPR